MRDWSRLELGARKEMGDESKPWIVGAVAAGVVEGAAVVEGDVSWFEDDREGSVPADADYLQSAPNLQTCASIFMIGDLAPMASRNEADGAVFGPSWAQRQPAGDCLGVGDLAALPVAWILVPLGLGRVMERLHDELIVGKVDIVSFQLPRDREDR